MRTRKRYIRVPVKTEHVGFGGGLVDDKTPIMSIPPGHVRSSQNVVERFNGGYEVAPAYERYDGQTPPSEATFATLTVTLSRDLLVGETITNEDETASALIISTYIKPYPAPVLIKEYPPLLDDASDWIIDDTGDWIGEETVTIATCEADLVLTKLSGDISPGPIKVDGIIVGSCSESPQINGAETALLRAKYTALAADSYREDIEPIPGSGPVLGVWMYKDTVYGFRDNDAGTKSAMYRATSSGWSKVDLGHELSFTAGGTYEIQEGDTITGATSGATAVVTKVVLESGTFTAGDAAGRLIFESQTGTFQAENLDVGVNATVATILGDSSAIAFSVPKGSFHFINANFTGSVDTKYMYGADGKNRGFEFDGTTFTPIDTGMTLDAPEMVYEHHNHLFYTYGGWLQHSSPGLPYQWSPIVNAGGLAMGDTITGLAQQPGSESQATLCVADRNSTAILYGTSVDDWNLVSYKNEIGAIAGTTQRIGRTYMLDDRGIVEITTAQQYGNFKDATVSQKVNEWLKTKKTQVTTSLTIANKNQYWLFFQDKTALCCTINDGKMTSFMPCRFNHVVCCAFAFENESGEEIVMFGDENGYVHQFYKGTSFDGEELEWFFDLSFDPLSSPMTTKKFRMGRFEVMGDGYAEFNFSYCFEYETDQMEPGASTHSELDLNSVTWDNFTWDNFTWDGKSLTPQDFEIKGSGVNISMSFKGSSNMFSPLVFPGAFIQFTPTKDIQ